MNTVQLIGRLTKDPEVRYTASQMAVTKFNLAVDRPVKKGEEKQTDFIRIVVFGKQAENCEKYLSKGKRASIVGRIQSGSYTNNAGQTVYTTDVVAERVEFLDYANSATTNNVGQNPAQTQRNESSEHSNESYSDDFMLLDEDVPF